MGGGSGIHSASLRLAHGKAQISSTFHNGRFEWLGFGSSKLVSTWFPQKCISRLIILYVHSLITIELRSQSIHVVGYGFRIDSWYYNILPFCFPSVNNFALPRTAPGWVGSFWSLLRIMRMLRSGELATRFLRYLRNHITWLVATYLDFQMFVSFLNQTPT